MKNWTVYEQEHRVRSLRYYRLNVESVRTYKRNKYRLKVGIPLNSPIKKTNTRVV